MNSHGGSAPPTAPESDACDEGTLNSKRALAVLGPWGRRYCLLYEPWIDLVNIVEDRPNLDVNAPARWLSDDLYERGIQVDIHNLIPPRILPVLMDHKNVVSARSYR